MHPVCLLLEKPRQAVQYNEWKFTVSTLQLPLVGLLVLLLCYTCLTASFQDNLGSWKHNIKPFWVLLQQQDNDGSGWRCWQPELFKRAKYSYLAPLNSTITSTPKLSFVPVQLNAKTRSLLSKDGWMSVTRRYCV